ncbi:MAG: DUF5320 domain-containing protein [Deltaproteobacteria bacterium]|nr:DUF5320 domain-containing protein [Deltaproteobacteria bacterium]MBW2151291.1 DUF5320 domain-containing protein [Deltaproteobacteria bacterium]
MPGFDGTGPRGEGPMTGGGRGYCNPAWAGYRPLYGRRFGYSRGYRGRGFRRGFGPGYGLGIDYAPGYGMPYSLDSSKEVDMLKAEAEAMKNDLDEINKRIEELEKESSE